MNEYRTLKGAEAKNGIPARKKLKEPVMKDAADGLEKQYGVKVPA